LFHRKGIVLKLKQKNMEYFFVQINSVSMQYGYVRI